MEVPSEHAATTSLPNNILLLWPGPSPLHGTGLATTQNLQSGDEIIAEKPLLRIHGLEDDTTDATINKLLRKIRNLDQSQKQELIYLVKRYDADFEGMELPAFTERLGHPDDKMKDTLIRATKIALFPPASKRWNNSAWLCPYLYRLNHSCIPNAEASWDTSKQRIILKAIRPIQKDTEITISYINQFRSRKRRYRKLGFKCNCAACKLRGEQFRQFERNYILTGQRFETVLAFRKEYNKAENEVFTVDPGEAQAIREDPNAVNVLHEAGTIIRTTRYKHSALVQASDTAAAISTALAITAEDEESREDDYCKAMMFKLYELDVLKLCLGEDRWRTGQTLRQIERIGMKSTLALRKWQEKTRMGA